LELTLLDLFEPFMPTGPLQRVFVLNPQGAEVRPLEDLGLRLENHCGHILFCWSNRLYQGSEPKSSIWVTAEQALHNLLSFLLYKRLKVLLGVNLQRYLLVPCERTLTAFDEAERTMA
jgi:hypothetical protein